MRQHDIDWLLQHPSFVNKEIQKNKKQELITQEPADRHHIIGHVQKAEHNLSFIHDILKTRYTDWAVTGCYYACYHAALGLILTKGFKTKNHHATLLLLIDLFYDTSLHTQDIATFAELLDYYDILFYVEAKQKREEATYTTHTSCEKNDVTQLHLKTVLFVDKCKHIINSA